MADDSASTVMTMRCQPLNSTLEAVECESFVVHDYIKRQVILVPTNFTTSHDVSLGDTAFLLRESGAGAPRLLVNFVVRYRRLFGQRRQP